MRSTKHRIASVRNPTKPIHNKIRPNFPKKNDKNTNGSVNYPPPKGGGLVTDS